MHFTLTTSMKPRPFEKELVRLAGAGAGQCVDQVQGAVAIGMEEVDDVY